ncbi:MAG: hypothetical protein HQL41_07140, partial [Alphaproteobacteria bacterium]|nr:hypothetical protein [Alphaproteobacteria bacterium]
PDGPVLAVQADDAAALGALIRPLPHYGGQGWLVFEGAKAADRGQWPAGGGAGLSCRLTESKP